MVPLRTPRLATVAVVSATVAAAVAVAVTPSVAVAAPRAPSGGRVAGRPTAVDEATAVTATADGEGWECLPALAPTCDLEAHMDLPSMEKCLPDSTHSQHTLAAHSAFASIKAMVAAAHPAAHPSAAGTCCFAKKTLVDIHAALVALAPSVHCVTGVGVALPGILNDVMSPLSNVPSGITFPTGWAGSSLGSGSVVIPGDNRLWCCDAQHYAPNDPANRPCCVDGCYVMAATFGWMGFNLDSCCGLLNNREQYGRVCPPGTIRMVLVHER